jgi:hypothetical protein
MHPGYCYTWSLTGGPMVHVSRHAAWTKSKFDFMSRGSQRPAESDDRRRSRAHADDILAPLDSVHREEQFGGGAAIYWSPELGRRWGATAAVRARWGGNTTAMNRANYGCREVQWLTRSTMSLVVRREEVDIAGIASSGRRKGRARWGCCRRLWLDSLRGLSKRRVLVTMVTTAVLGEASIAGDRDHRWGPGCGVERNWDRGGRRGRLGSSRALYGA